jgi:pimeloyl-ACP methyl ester carboxylesterase
MVLLAASIAAVIWAQDELLFPTHAVGPPGPLPRGAERIIIDAPGSIRLHGVHIAPATAAQGRTLVLGFGGNAWNGDDVGSYLHRIYPHADVIAFHYRGYRPSTGTPSAHALLADAQLVFDAAVKRVKPERTVAVGFSIGSGVAAGLARQRPVDGLVLVTPFDTLKALARDLYPWLPVGLVLRHQLDVAGSMEGTQVPTAIVAAERDEIVPPARTAALRSKVANLVYDRTIAGAGHNDLYGLADFEKAMGEALARVGGGG